MKGSSIITAAVVGIGGWWLYNNWATIAGANAGVAAGEVPPPPGAPVTAPTAGGIVPATPPPPAPPAATASTPPPSAPPAPNYAAAMDTATLIAKLQAAANGAVTLNQDQWDYYRNTLVPPALTGEQMEMAFPRANGELSLSAGDFVNRLHAVGLAAYRPRAMRGARMINYRRAA